MKYFNSCRRNERGFTLIELMVVLLILGLLASIAGPRLMKQFGKAKHQTAEIQIDALAAAVNFFALDVGRYPDDSEGLNALTAPISASNWDGPYIDKPESLVDPWGNPYLYQRTGSARGFTISSLGADGQPGGDGDNADIVLD